VNRTIQFRIFDQLKRRFIPDFPAIFPPEGALATLNGIILGGRIYQESTGCGDCQGQLIFEGDLLMDTDRNIHGGGLLGEVIFLNGCFQVKPLGEDLDTVLPFSSLSFGDTRVVGHIFEDKKEIFKRTAKLPANWA
jgi:hypothetical protein